MRCPVLECSFRGRRDAVILHMENHHPQVGGTNADLLNIFPFVEIQAFRGYIRTYRHRYQELHQNMKTPADYLQEMKSKIRNIISVNTVGNRTIKVQVSLLCEFVRGDIDTPDAHLCNHYINSNQKIVFNIHSFDDFLGSVLEDITNIIEIFEEHGSGWKVSRIRGADIRIGKYIPRRGRCHVSFPKSMSGKKAIINVKNNDNMCFKWAFLSVMHYTNVRRNRDRIYQYKPFENRYNFEAINFPPTMKEISNFEKHNADKKIAINIFECDTNNSNISVKRISPNMLLQDHKAVDLLLYHDYAQGKSHYAGIPKLGKLFGKRNSHRREFCYNCQNMIASKKYKLHVKNCINFKTQRVSIPSRSDGKNEEISFRDYYKQLPHEYVMYADFESVMKPPTEESGGDCTTNLSRHIPSGFFVLLVGKKEGIVDHFLYRGENCVHKFFEIIQLMSYRVKQIYDGMIVMKDMTNAEIREHYLSSKCHICKKPFEKDEKKAHDHDHSTGKYRGAAHIMCNTTFSLKKRKLPIFLHNFRKYDVHLILGGFKFYEGKISVIPTNFEQYISIICDKFILLDSLMFLSLSLDQLVSRLRESNDNFENNFKLLIDFFGKSNAKLLCRKGVYFYDFVRNFEMFDTKVFPAKKKFYNVLSESHISDEDYIYACNVFEKFCTTLGDYHDLYLQVDTILLACVMENFRNLALTFYKLDPSHFYSLSGFTWDAALLMTGAKLSKLMDIDMYEFFELGLRGGVSMISKRYARINNKYLDDFNPSRPSSFIFSADCNNLYGFALQQKLPVSDFKWMSQKQIKRLNVSTILSWPDDGDEGHVLMVDLAYPRSLHSRDNDYPLAPEKLNVSYEMLSKYQKQLLSVLDIKYSSKIKKLIPHLGDRKNYIVHFRNLKYYLQKGLILEKIHAVISFKQMAWLRPYIEFNTKKRQEASDQFAKDLFKFLINACFGKSCENVRKRKNVIICNNVSDVQRHVQNHNFRRFEIINSEVVIIEMAKNVIRLDKAIYTGFACLELSKLIMFNFHYDVIKKFYGSKAQLLQTDTDSLNYIIETKDLYHDLKHKNLNQHFDFSDYPSQHHLFSILNKKVMGKFKDEAISIVVKEFCGLAPKMYSFVGENLWKKAAKGVKRSVVNRNLLHNVFKTVLFKQKKVVSKMNMIRSKGHKLHTVSINKLSLHAFDSKRYILDDGVSTLAHNHYKIKKG